MRTDYKVRSTNTNILIIFGISIIIDEEKDSLRCYNLGNKYQGKAEHFGAKEGYRAEGVLMM